MTPPYNTGNEGWVYNDNVNSPLINDWIGKVVGKDGEDLTRHDKWLCMMMPRLKLLKELLSDDGVIFISIDDNEIHHLRELADEIFGAGNFITNFIWKKKSTSTNVEGVQVSSLTDYVICYGRSNKAKLKPRVRAKETRSYPYKDKGGNYRLAIIEKKHAGSYKRDSMLFEILGQRPRPGKRWQIGQELALKLEGEERLVAQNGVIKRKIYDFEDKDTFSAQPNLLDNYGTTDSAQKLLTEIFGKAEVFDNPKPPELIKHLISISCDDSDLVLDSFAGSGTTAQAVLELNRKSGGKRKFILVELENKVANDITAERARRVIKGLPNSKNTLFGNGLGGTFSYFELGDAIETSSLLSGSKLPSYKELARYIFYTATGEEINESAIDESKDYVGKSNQYEVYMLYKPDIEYLKTTALTLDAGRKLRNENGDKQLLVFAPTKYIEQTELDNLKITFCQLPFEIYKVA